MRALHPVIRVFTLSRFLVGDEGGLYMEREAQVLTGLMEHVLPRVGSHTLSLDLAHGKAVSNAIVSYVYTDPEW